MESVYERFMQKVAIIPFHACWEWTASKRRGYGQFSVLGKPVYAHRFVYSLFNKENISDKIIMHTCDNPGCVNPMHLRAGTQQDNIADKVAKSRHCKRTSHGSARLSESDISDIKEARSRGATYRSLGKKYGMYASHMSLICRGKRWR